MSETTAPLITMSEEEFALDRACLDGEPEQRLLGELKAQRAARAREQGMPQEAIEQIARYVFSQIHDYLGCSFGDANAVAQRIREGKWQTP